MITQRAISYGAINFSCAAMHNIFITYYVHFFMESLSISDGWFFAGEIVFMIWNSLNDPLCGWILDHYQIRTKNIRLKVQQRIPIIRYGGLAWCLVFLSLFVPLSYQTDYVGIHFMLSLCLYDGMLSLVTLAHGSLLADITLNSSERAQCNMWGSSFSLVGSTSVLFAQFFWDKENVVPFQIFCLVTATISAIIFLVTSKVLEREFAVQQTTPDLSIPAVPRKHCSPTVPSTSGSIFVAKEMYTKIKQYGKELWQLPNFWVFAVVNLVQVFNCHFNSNFLSISMERLLDLDQALSARQISALLLTSSALFPHLLVILLTPVQKAFGLHSLLSGLFVWKFIAAFFVFIFGSAQHWALICLFLFINKSFSEAICKHGNLVIADLVDEDQLVNKRTGNSSAMMFGACAFFARPGQSIAPLVGWSVLSYHNFRDNGDESELHAIMFSMLCFIPMACALVQLLMWQKFSLRGSYLRQVKSKLKEQWKSIDV